MQVKRSHEGYIYLRHLTVCQVAFEVTKTADIDGRDLLAKCGRALAGTFNPHMRRHGLFVLAGQVHDFYNRAVLITQRIRDDDGRPTRSLLGSDRFARIDIENIATIDTHKRIVLSLIIK